MKNKLYLSSIAIIILAFSLILGFVLDGMDSMAISSGTPITLYWVSKGIVLGLFVIITLYIILRKQDVGNIYILINMTLIIQILPFVQRLLLRGDNPSIVWSLIVLFLSLLIYVGLFFGFDVLNDKIQKADTKLQGKSIEVVDEDQYNDSDGRFVSANKKG